MYAPSYHAGELAVQRRAGTTETSARVLRSIGGSIHWRARAFLREQPWVILGSADSEGRIWASLLAGLPGFARALDAETVEIRESPADGDPLAERVAAGGSVGLLAIDLSTRRRLRVNGIAERMEADRFRIRAKQVYGNCPKYIQARSWKRDPESRGEVSDIVRGSTLSAEQLAWIGAADTLFIASGHPEAGMDASHRGGMPGFVRVRSDGTLLFPDYAGNTMFNTLGNITANARVGLLFPDFHRGRTLQVSGTASVVWDPRMLATLPGAERAVEVRVEHWIERVGAIPFRWEFEGYSPFNPR